MEMPPFTILMGIYIVCVTIYSSLARWVRRRKGARKAKAPNNLANNTSRPRAKQGRKLLVWQSLLMTIILHGFLVEKLDGAEFGFNDLPIFSLLTGLVTYFLFNLIYTIILKITGHLGRFLDLNFRVLRSIWPAEKSQKPYAFIAMGLLNPITEEFFYRGIIVFWLGKYIGLVSIALGFVIHLTVHLYQGKLAFVTHTFFYLIVVMLVYSPLGLFAAIGFHFAGDLVPVLTFRKQMDAWVKRKREARMNG